MTPRTARIAASATLAFMAVGGLLFGHPGDGDDGAAYVATGVIMLVALALGVRAWRGWPLVAVQAATVPLFPVACDLSSANVGLFGVCFLAGWAAQTEPLRRAFVVPLVGVVTFAVSSTQNPDPGWLAWSGGTLLTVWACFSTRRQNQLVTQLREAQAGLADRARTEERVRIAHELHDVIGHALTVSLLHVTSARLALAEDPAEADASLAEAERLSQQSLAEVRAVVGLMRDAEATLPLPGSAEIADLVESFRRAGTPVDWSVDGDLASLTATEGLTVYRIVQEALTNVVRHAPGAAVTARLVVGDGSTTVVVDSDGSAPGPIGEGVGLAGMRARAEALGGRLTAGPAPHGWRVEAVLPS